MLIVVVVLIAIQLVLDYREYHKISNDTVITKRPLVVRWILYFVLVFVIIRFGAFGVSSFIYFGF